MPYLIKSPLTRKNLAEFKLTRQHCPAIISRLRYLFSDTFDSTYLKRMCNNDGPLSDFLNVLYNALILESAIRYTNILATF